MSDHPVYIAGHSLGGADAFIYARQRLKRGLRVDGIIALAPARPGDHRLAAELQAAKLDVISLANHGDPVPDKPFDMPSVDEEYEQPFPFQMIDVPPPKGSDFLFGRHKVCCYVTACQALPQGHGPIPLGHAATEIARLYDDATGWDWINAVDGLYWAMTTINGARLMIRRGSQTRTDWFREDFDAFEIKVDGARVSRGFWIGVGPIEYELDAALA